MKPEARFRRQSPRFWANVRLISQEVGYTKRGKNLVMVPTFDDIKTALEKIGLGWNHLIKSDDAPTHLGIDIRDYFTFRAEVLNEYVEPRLMDAERAGNIFLQLMDRLEPSCPLPMNKQKGDKKKPAFFTCIINMLIEANCDGVKVDYDPRKLTSVTKNGAPLRTLSRWLDGAIPSTVNPVAVWEVKEYYYTTTFGSRVADGVYESLLDGMELEELREHEGVDVKHYLMVDAYLTWWKMGKPYLCRIIDMLHMGYIDEILFGYEVVERLPKIVREWAELVRLRESEQP